MKKRVLAIFLSLALCLGLGGTVLAASDEAVQAADRLHELGLFQGVGTNADGTPNYDLDRAPTRAEAVTLLVRLLGKEADTKNETFDMPFTDVPDWAAPYVGYAYKNGLTNGTTATTFGSEETVSAAQYLTFVLRALGYDSSTDFSWEKAHEKTDELKITSGNYQADSAFTRGDAVAVSSAALDVKTKDGSQTLLELVQGSPAATPEITTGEVGKTYTTQWFTFSVDAVKTSKTYKNMEAIDGHTLLILTISEKNIWEGKDNIPMSLFDFLLDHESFEEYLLPQEPWDDAMMPEEFSLKPDESATYDLIFMVPTDVKTFDLVYNEIDEDDQIHATFVIKIAL